MAGLVEMLRSKEKADSKRYGGLVSLLLPEDDSQGYNPFLKQTPGAEGNNPMAMDTGGQPIPPAPHWVNSLTGLVEGTVNGFMAPANALAGKYDQMVIDPETGKVLSMMDPRLMDDAAAMAGLVTLGSGALPAEANALNMGIRAYHGSPKAGIETLQKSHRGPLGPGVYATPMESLAKRYAGDTGSLYSFEAPDELFHGMKQWNAGSDVNPYQTWRDQAAAVLNVTPTDKQAEVKALFEKMWPDDGYAFFQRLSGILGSKEDAQALLKNAGYKGMTAFVDGPEMVMFDTVALP